jgi:transcriptional regulator with XRE-family HTH domain
MTHHQTNQMAAAMSLDDIVAQAKAMRLSRSQLCRRAGVHETTVARNLKGETRPNTATVEKLRFALADYIKETT